MRLQGPNIHPPGGTHSCDRHLSQPPHLPEAGNVRLIVYDVLGRSVMRLVDGEKEAGRYEVIFDARDLASGTYFYELKAGDFTQVHKMILSK